MRSKKTLAERAGEDLQVAIMDAQGNVPDEWLDPMQDAAEAFIAAVAKRDKLRSTTAHVTADKRQR